MVHLINYRLNRPGQNYDSLYSAISSLSGDHWHNTTSSWLVDSSYTSTQIYNHLRPHIDANDELVVFRITRDWMGQLLPANLTWLQSRNY